MMFAAREEKKLDVSARRPSILYLGILFLSIIFSLILNLSNEGNSEPSDFRLIIYNLIIILIAFSIRKTAEKKPSNYLSPDVIFTAIYSVFHFFYIFLYTFGVVGIDWEVFWKPEKVVQATIYSVMCLSIFLFAYELTGAVFRANDGLISPCTIDNKILVSSKILLLFCFSLFWGFLLYVGLSGGLKEYREIIRLGNNPGGRLFWFSQYLAMVGLCIYCAGSGILYHKTMHGKIFSVLVFLFISSVLLLGDRGGFIYLAIVPVMTYHYFQNRIKLYVMCISVLVTFFIMGFIGITRSAAVLDLPKATEVYEKKVSENNVIIQTGLEFGTTLKTVVIAMALVPSKHDYWLGKSYIDAFKIVVPNVMPGATRISKGLAVWLTESAFGKLDNTHGRGGSIAMEAYMNFGFYGGALSFLFVGWFFRFIYERYLSKPNLMNAVVLLSASSGLMLWVRNTSNAMPRNIIWAMVTCWILINMSKLFRDSHQNKKRQDSSIGV